MRATTGTMTHGHTHTHTHTHTHYNTHTCMHTTHTHYTHTTHTLTLTHSGTPGDLLTEIKQMNDVLKHSEARITKTANESANVRPLQHDTSATLHAMYCLPNLGSHSDSFLYE